MEPENLPLQRTDLSQLQEAIQAVTGEIGKVIVGQQEMIELLMTAILADGHVLLEGVPGIAKTLAAKLLAKCLDTPFSRIQFTPDLMPSDVLGTSIFNPTAGGFEFRKGPIFSSIILIDEINRSPAKTQAALFEVMEEKQVTIDGHTYLMEQPFMVVATQNPIEQEGTYRLPEAQLDRFLFKITITYPSAVDEMRILTRLHESPSLLNLEEVNKILSAENIIAFRNQVKSLLIDPKLIQFIVDIVQETRNNPAIYLGASPRASVAIMQSSKAMAALNGRDFVTPEDIIRALPPILRHRIELTPEKEMEGLTTDMIIQSILKKMEIPR